MNKRKNENAGYIISDSREHTTLLATAMPSFMVIYITLIYIIL